MKIQWLIFVLVAVAALSCRSAAPAVVSSTGFTGVARVALTEEQQRRFDFYFYEGLRLKEEGLFQQALDSLLISYSLDSLDAGLLAEMALMQASLDKNPESVQNMQKALELDPDNWWFNMQLFRLYMHNKRNDEALKLAEQLHKKYPLKEEVYSLLIPLYQQNERFEEAVKLYDQLESITGINERISFDKMRLHLMLNQPRKATSEIDKLIQKYPYENRFRVLKGDFLMQQKQPEKALELYQEVLADEPQNPHAQISMSEYYNLKGDAVHSLEYVVAALKNNQLEIEMKIDILGQHIENLLKSERKLEDTEELFKLLIEYYPRDERVHEYYAAYLQHQKREKDALEVYESILAINPKKETVWFGIMQLHFSNKEYDKVIEVADRAIEALDNNLRAYYFKAITYDLAGDSDKAIETHMQALPLFKDGEQPLLRSDFYSHLAELNNKLGKHEDAFAAYEESLKHNPDNIGVLNNYAYNLSIHKTELAKAERMSARTIEKEPRNSTYLDTYAWIFYQQGNYSLAKFYIERAISYLTDKQDKGVYYEHYGDILWMTRTNDDKALENWKKAWDAGVQTDELKQKIENKGWKRD
ncbi:MAG: tetratricopeptide repeat protein [Paludibacter sp.]|jgi:tetratricopeptide (TPR) repeat protein|nr:tetratricopeptide repeat protein [Paludibacter sp.]